MYEYTFLCRQNETVPSCAVHGFQDCLKIQSDLKKLSEWCKANTLELNVGKFKSISLPRRRHPV
jgi:hypothetical protein